MPGVVETLTDLAADGGDEAFEYNRDNFMYDRKLRLRAEFKMQDFKVSQARLWREDIRDLISLSQYKMHVYLLVNVLLLGHTIVLWCQGKLPDHTPDWLMAGFSIASGGAMMFLLLSIWMAMYAAVAAQAYETRFLTQLVRLPIPSWQEIEGCRTCGSEFEQVDSRQMFRVPFVSGRQEDLVRPEQGAANFEAGVPGEPGTAAEERPADPWGLEKTGRSIKELGCPDGSEVGNLRHIKIVREAMIGWQSYDAFARISMSVGVNQLLLAMSYYILGYVLVEVGSRDAATCGVVLFAMLSEALLRLDLSLSIAELRQLQSLMAIGPAASTIACYLWINWGEECKVLAEAFATVAFCAHGAFIMVLSYLAKSDPMGRGEAPRLPKAFSSVLYLDVFGWVSAAESAAAAAERVELAGGEVAGGGGGAAASEATRAAMLPSPSVASAADFDSNWGHEISSNSGYLAEEYGSPAADHAASLQRRGAGAIGADATRPSLQNRTYRGGRAQRPEDLAPPGFAEDLRGLPGAPREPTVGAPLQQQAVFYDADSWLRPPHGISDSKATGHGGETAKVLPWQVFTSAMRSLCAVWFVAALYHCASMGWGWDLRVREPPVELVQAAFFQVVSPPGGLPAGAASSPITASSSSGSIHLERVQATIPDGLLQASSLACDAAGERFVASDGLFLFGGTLQGPGGQQQNAVGNRRLVWERTQCSGLEGEGLQDVAVECKRDGTDRSCDALVLHRHGRMVTACSLQPGSPATSAFAGNISDGWLEHLRPPSGSASEGSSLPRHHARFEKVVALALNGQPCAACAHSGAVVLATSKGRIVQVKQGTSRNGVLLPEAVLASGDVVGTMRAGGARSLGGGMLGVLESDGRRISVLDPVQGGGLVGQFSLPASLPAAGFCAGGGRIYLLEAGAEGRLWSFKLPEHPDAHYALWHSGPN